MSLAAKGRMDSISSGPDRPVIFLPGYGRDETIARALELGVTDYVVKPFSPTELVTRIQAALRKQAGPTEPFRSVFGHDGVGGEGTLRTDKIPSERESVDESGHNIREQNARANLSTFIMTSDRLIRSLRNGQSWQV